MSGTEIEALAKDLGIAVSAEAVYLFGSRAKGTESEGSDFDLAFVFTTREQVKDGVRRAHHLLWPRPFPVDIVGLARSTIREGRTALARNILREGKVLYLNNGD